MGEASVVLKLFIVEYYTTQKGKTMKYVCFIAILAVAGLIILSGCDDAAVVSQNLSKDADMFKINRRVVFYNGITGEWILSIEGRCSINIDRIDKQLEVIVKTSETTYKKHFLGLSDNVTYFAEQLEAAEASTYHYKVIFKPSVIVPSVELH